MREIPILFCGDMIRAILDGRKTMTRRIRFTGKVGDILWVRETWARIFNGEGCIDWEARPCPTGCLGCKFEYRADTENKYPGEWDSGSGNDPGCPKWKPSIFMPREACRIKLKVIRVIVQNIQAISKRDAIREGISAKDPIGDFQQLWDSLNAKRGLSWNLNPEVYAITFRRI